MLGMLLVLTVFGAIAGTLVKTFESASSSIAKRVNEETEFLDGYYK